MTTAADISRRFPKTRRPSVSKRPEPLDAQGSSRWLFAVIVVQFATQLALLTGLGGLRSIVRTVAFAASLACLVFVPQGGVRHPARTVTIVIFALIGLQILNPETAGVLGGLAQFALYIAIIAPVFWVSRLKIDIADFRRIITFFWLFCTASACVGMLQVYFPGRFEPDSLLLEQNAYADSLKITLANGTRIFRPMGLTDTAGGAAIAGFYTCVVGTGLLLGESRWPWRLVVFAGMLVGVFVIYLSYVRVLLVVSLICFIGNAVMLGLRGRIGKFFTYGILVVGLFLVAWVLAIDVGGDNVRSRVTSLTASSVNDVYYSNRGVFLQHTLDELLPLYPLGGGLARWGMMGVYFGDFTGTSSIYVEINWTGWLLDGGIPLVIAYPLAILLCMWTAAKIALGRLGGGMSDFWIWGGVMFGYDLGALAFTFDAVPFLGTLGLEFWMLNAMLFVVAVRGDRAALAGNS